MSLKRALMLLLGLMIVITYYGPGQLYRSMLGGSAAKVRRSTRAPRATVGSDGTASLVWVMLGDPHFQFYLLESIRQARLWNPTSDFFLVVEPPEFDKRPEWRPQLAELGVHIVNYTTLTDPFVHEFRRQYEFLWDQLGRKLGAMMLPTVNGKTNMAFTMVTMERLVAVHQLMAVLKLGRVVHIENDQMTYGPIDRIRTAAESCGLRLGMSRVGARLAPAVVYAADAPALKEMLDFILEAISHGVDHAIAVAGTGWVTDMSLPAVYFDAHEAAGHSNVSTLPNRVDFSDSPRGCMYRATRLVFDGLALGMWCCGDFEHPNKHFEVRLRESGVPYWDYPFEWPVRSGRRLPVWNGSDVFNLHMHSKQLHLFRSTDPAIPKDAKIAERN